MKRILFLFICVLSASGLYAQKTLAQLQTEAISIRDAGVGQNTAVKVGSSLLDFVNSYVPVIDYAVATGTNAYSATVNSIVTQYVHGQVFRIEFQNANTASSTLNLNGLGAILLTSDGNNALTAGMISAGQEFFVYYNGTSFQLNGVGGVPTSRQITINGNTQSLASDPSWTIVAGVSSFNSRTGSVTPQISDYNSFYSPLLPSTNRQTSNYTFALTDVGKTVEMNVSSSNTLTIPSNSSVPFPLYTQLVASNYGAGTTTVTAGSGVTFRNASGILTLNQYGFMYALKIGTDEWYLIMPSTGLINSSNVLCTVTNDNATAGYLGEYPTEGGTSTYTNYTTTATYQQIGLVQLTAGDWDIRAEGTLSTNSATLTSTANAEFLISTTSASATGSIQGKSVFYIAQSGLTGTASKQSISIPSFRVTIAAGNSPIYYLNTQATFSAGNPQFVGFISARRVR